MKLQGKSKRIPATIGCAIAVVVSSPTIGGAIAIGAACGSALISHASFVVDFFDDNKDRLIHKTAEYVTIGNCVKDIASGILGSGGVGTVVGVVGCALSVVEVSMTEKEENWKELTNLLIERQLLEEAFQDLTKCITVKTVVSSITNSSAIIGANVTSEGCNDVRIEGLKIEWGSNLESGKYSDDYSTFTIPISNLTPNTQYCARAVVLLNDNRCINGNIVYFTTLPENDLTLSTYEMSFPKEGGTDFFTINTSLTITKISSTQGWCTISYDANVPDMVFLTVDENKTKESRTATVWVDAINPVTNEKMSKGVLINQTAEEETGFFAGTAFNKTMWIVDVSENTVGTINYDVPQTEWSTVKDELVVTGHKHESDQYNYPKNYETEFYFYGDYVFAGGGYYTSDFSGKIQNGQLVDFDGSALEDNINVKLINSNTLQMKTERTTTEGGSKWVTDYTMTITINSISSISATSIENMTYTSQPKDKYSLQNYIDKSISTSTYIGTPTEFIDIDFDEIFKIGKSTINKSNSIREREKELINKEL